MTPPGRRRQRLAVIGRKTLTAKEKSKNKADNIARNAARQKSDRRLKRMRTLLDLYCQPPKVQAARRLNRAALLAELCELTRETDPMDALRVTREQIPHKRKRGGGIGVAVPGQATAQPFGERTTRIRSVVVNSVGNGKRR